MRYTTEDIAVVIPAYNCAGFIQDTLESLFRQRELPGEVIVVNDGSTDNTDEVIRGSRYFPLIRYCQVENGGPAAARNHGVAQTARPWVAFLDADDNWVHWHKLEMQIELANLHPQAVLIDTFAEVHWGEDRVLTIDRHKDGWVFEQFLTRNVINATSSVLASTEAIRKVGGFDEDIRFGEDRLLWASLACRGQVHTVPQVTVRKVNHEGNLTACSDRNYQYRIQCVERLIRMAKVKGRQVDHIWYENLEEFFRDALRANNVPQYRNLFEKARKLSGGRVYWSRHALINAYGSLVGNFNLLNQLR
ncbi:glycosyltransferase [Bowmanella dokdonensis]|uniref:Glycosyltransferase family 2 protein n=1 Tax=Bowmanella dokdonensis TaxID=751969 RepID=A0A939DLE5_9ALTE|nr:glycosyltransferase family 2 protein [Bowmanella dokdonensis]